jgi:hypothetical protein
LKRAGRGDHPAWTGDEFGFFAEDRYQSFRRLAPPMRAAYREPDELLCRHLSARVWTVRHPALPVAPSPYSCQRTLRSEGPDGGAALPDDCTDERDCFEPADRRGDPES